MQIFNKENLIYALMNSNHIAQMHFVFNKLINFFNILVYIIITVFFLLLI